MTRMRRGQIALLGAPAAIAATVSLSPTLAAGQAGQLAAPKDVATRTETTPRTPWGDPDLRGIWTNTTLTPFERSDDQATTAQPTGEPSGSYDPNVSSVGAYNEFWTDRADLERDGQGTSNQTALVVDPPDGKLPPLTPPARKYADELEALRRPERPASWVELNPYDRCITRGLPGGMNPGLLQPQLPDSPDAGPRRDPRGNDSRNAHHPARPTPTPWVRSSAMDGELARPVGRRDAGGRHHRFQRQDQGVHRERAAAPQWRTGLAVSRLLGNPHAEAC